MGFFGFLRSVASGGIDVRANLTSTTNPYEMAQENKRNRSTPGDLILLSQKLLG